MQKVGVRVNESKIRGKERSAMTRAPRVMGGNARKRGKHKEGWAMVVEGMATACDKSISIVDSAIV
jgi:hypothetical protein